MTFAVAIPALVILLIFGIYLIFIYATSIIEIAINIPLLWVLITRGHVEITHGRRSSYLAALAVSTLIFLLLWNFKTRFFVWWITQYLILIYLLAQLFYYLSKKKGRKR